MEEKTNGKSIKGNRVHKMEMKRRRKVAGGGGGVLMEMLAS